MGAFHTRIEYRDCYTAAARRNVPRLWRLDFWQMPGKGVVRVVWNQARLVDAIRLCELDARVALQCVEHAVPRGFRDFDDAHIDLVNGRVLLCAVGGKEVLQI